MTHRSIKPYICFCLGVATSVFAAGCPFEPRSFYEDPYNDEGPAPTSTSGDGGEGSSSMAGGGMASSSGEAGGTGNMPPPGGCPQLPSNTTYYPFAIIGMNSCYLLVTGTYSWTDAAARCWGDMPGATLAMVSSEDEHDALKEKFKEILGLNVEQRIWIGGLRNLSEDLNASPDDANSFIWMFGEPWNIPPCDNGSPDCSMMLTTFWSENSNAQPSGSGRCVQYVQGQPWKYAGLNDNACDEEYNYLCELKQ